MNLSNINNQQIDIKNKKMNDEEDKNETLSLDKIPNFIDLFCGIGGFHKGLVGFNCVFACDIDEKCRESYYINYKINPNGDIFGINIDNIPQHDILCAGFPCQPFSSAGKRKGFDDERFKVYEKLIEIINIKQPNIIILENVKNLTTMNKGILFEKIKKDLINNNYNVSHSLLNVSNFGLPQNRERIFIIGINKFYKNKYFDFTFLNSIKINNTLKDIIDLSNHNYIDKTKYILIDDKHKIKQKSGLLFCGYIKGNIRGNGTTPNTEHLSRVHKQPNRIYHIDGVNPTLNSSENAGRYYIYDENGVRTLTLDECYSIMGFNNFILHKKKNICYKQIGNSVCPTIIKFIKDELIKQNLIFS
jgi:DNA (cytosine-5)-methyltransferase 1